MKNCLRALALARLFFYVVFLVLCLAAGCQPKGWICREVISDCPKFDSVQLKYPTDNLFNGIEVELLKGEFGNMHFGFPIVDARTKNEKSTLVGILNVFSRHIPSDQVTLIVGDISYTSQGYVLEGGQRLLLPADVTEMLIQALLEGQNVTIFLEDFAAEICPQNFLSKYQRL